MNKTLPLDALELYTICETKQEHIDLITAFFDKGGTNTLLDKYSKWLYNRELAHVIDGWLSVKPVENTRGLTILPLDKAIAAINNCCDIEEVHPPKWREFAVVDGIMRVPIRYKSIRHAAKYTLNDIDAILRNSPRIKEYGGECLDNNGDACAVKFLVEAVDLNGIKPFNR